MTARQNYMAVAKAGRALRALVADPEDSARVFEIVEALRPRDRTPVLDRLRSTEEGAALLAERPSIRSALQRARLAALPEGTLGRAYLAYLDASGITAEGLVSASQIARGPFCEEGVWMSDRMRDTHDLWHTITGYGSDVAGEMLVLSFSYAQTKAPGLGLIVLASLIANLGTQMGADITLAYVRGLSAAWLPAVAWETLLERPIAEVRALLKVGEPPSYQPIDVSSLSETSIVSRLLQGHKNPGLPALRKETPLTRAEEQLLKSAPPLPARKPQPLTSVAPL